MGQWKLTLDNGKPRFDNGKPTFGIEKATLDGAKNNIR